MTHPGEPTAVERIRGLRLSDKEIDTAAHRKPNYHRGDVAWAGAEAQFTKLLEGLAAWLAVEVAANDISGYTVLGVLKEVLQSQSNRNDEAEDGQRDCDS